MDIEDTIKIIANNIKDAKDLIAFCNTNTITRKTCSTSSFWVNQFELHQLPIVNDNLYSVNDWINEFIKVYNATQLANIDMETLEKLGEIDIYITVGDLIDVLYVPKFAAKNEKYITTHENDEAKVSMNKNLDGTYIIYMDLPEFILKPAEMSVSMNEKTIQRLLFKIYYYQFNIVKTKISFAKEAIYQFVQSLFYPNY